MASSSTQDLLIVGPGTLGSFVGELWKAANPGATVVGQTQSETSHDRLRSLGLNPVLKPGPEEEAPKFPNVLFSVPCVGDVDAYVSEAEAAVARWSGEGCLLFTSSTAVYEYNGQVVTEDSPVKEIGASPGSDRLLRSEQAVLKAGGNVLRLSAMYHSLLGHHLFFAKRGQCSRHRNFINTFLHYEDAGTLCVAILSGQGEGPYRGREFLGTDGAPHTFGEMMDATLAILKPETEFVFHGQNPDETSKTVDCSKTRKVLGWEPKHPNFLEFMAAGGKDLWNASGPAVPDTRPTGRSAAGWVELYLVYLPADSGRLLYHHSGTGKVSHEMPEEFKAAVASAAS